MLYFLDEVEQQAALLVQQMHPMHKLISKEQVCADIVDSAAGVVEQPFDDQQLCLSCEHIRYLNVVFFVEELFEVCLFFGDFLAQLVDYL